MQHADRMPVRMLAIYYDDPASVAEADLRSMACMSCLADVELPEGFSRQTLMGGEYAVLRHKGPYADLASAYQWLYGVWLPQSGRLPADQPCFEEYLNNPREVAPAELLTDIYVPLAPA
ncbi:GyrI-like domain-containing protein [Aliamphritea spongicola]|nr:GyrI-like domain-containing protein [Aliamphritea spongicola]